VYLIAQKPLCNFLNLTIQQGVNCGGHTSNPSTSLGKSTTTKEKFAANIGQAFSVIVDVIPTNIYRLLEDPFASIWFA